jgi:hypothetical protein
VSSRREFVTLLGGVAAAWPLAASAQQPGGMRRIGVLMASAADDPISQARFAAFVQGMSRLGWTDDRNVRIDTRWATTNADDLRRHAAELVALAPDVLVAATGTATVAPLLLDRGNLRSWLRPRIDVEAAWHQLALALSGIAEKVEERSWLRAVPVLEAIVAARRAMIFLASEEGDMLRKALTTRFAQGFLANEGLKAHLEAWATDPDTSEEDRIEARRMLDMILVEPEERLGKETRPAAFPTAAGREESGVGSEKNEQRLREEIRHLRSARSWVTTEKIEQVFLGLEKGIDTHPDYQASVRADVQYLLLFLLNFLSHCLDVGSRMAEGMFSFLFNRESGEPYEKELQHALFVLLRVQVGGFPQHQITAELPDVSAGRADVAIIRPNWRIVIEVKRELEDASREGIRRYLGQAASYTLTGPKIGVLMVLDLCSQKRWTLALDDNCWVESVGSEDDTIRRLVVVFRVPGMRVLPSATRTPN